MRSTGNSNRGSAETGSKVGQKDEFLAGEGDAWFFRNPGVSKRPESKLAGDPLLAAIRTVGLKPTSVLEVGSSNGWRLNALAREFGAEACGIDPSEAALVDGRKRYPVLDLRKGTADSLPFPEAQFDLVILGFCLYLCDRSDLFTIAAEVDRVLRDEGSVAIHDFTAPNPRRTPYRHRQGLYSYKMDYSRMFTWNPAYTLTFHRLFDLGSAERPIDPDQLECVSVIGRDMARAYSNIRHTSKASPA